MDSTNVLAVMGITGAGKSTFIKLVTGDSTVKIGHGQTAGKHDAVVQRKSLVLS
jgi:ABC-type hemin transport system ATPase subunit